MAEVPEYIKNSLKFCISEARKTLKKTIKKSITKSSIQINNVIEKGSKKRNFILPQNFKIKNDNAYILRFLSNLQKISKILEPLIIYFNPKEDCEYHEHNKEKRHFNNGHCKTHEKSKDAIKAFSDAINGFNLTKGEISKIGKSIAGTRPQDFNKAYTCLKKLNRFFGQSGLTFLRQDLFEILNIYSNIVLPLLKNSIKDTKNSIPYIDTTQNGSETKPYDFIKIKKDQLSNKLDTISDMLVRTLTAKTIIEDQNKTFNQQKQEFINKYKVDERKLSKDLKDNKNKFIIFSKRRDFENLRQSYLDIRKSFVSLSKSLDEVNLHLKYEGDKNYV